MFACLPAEGEDSAEVKWKHAGPLSNQNIA